MRRLPIVEVKWIDSASNDVWHDEDAELNVARCTSTGYLLTKNKKKIVLMTSRGETQIQGLLAIPRGCVKKIRKLR